MGSGQDSSVLPSGSGNPGRGSLLVGGMKVLASYLDLSDTIAAGVLGCLVKLHEGRSLHSPLVFASVGVGEASAVSVFVYSRVIIA